MKKEQAYYSQGLREKHHLDLAPRNDPKPVGEQAVQPPSLRHLSILAKYEVRY